MTNPVPESYEELFKRIKDGMHSHGLEALTFEHRIKVKLAFDQIESAQKLSAAAEKQSTAMARATWVLVVVAALQVFVTLAATTVLR